jgi:hypothetical protein
MLECRHRGTRILLRGLLRARERTSCVKVEYGRMLKDRVTRNQRVARDGREVACRRRQVSKPPHSATLPPLRRGMFNNLPHAHQFCCWPTAGHCWPRPVHHGLHPPHGLEHRWVKRLPKTLLGAVNGCALRGYAPEPWAIVGSDNRSFDPARSALTAAPSSA